MLEDSVSFKSRTNRKPEEEIITEEIMEEAKEEMTAEIIEEMPEEAVEEKETTETA